MKLSQISRQFFQLTDARALVVTDVKIDDTIGLWLFFLQNFRRPASHVVDLKVLITGVQKVRGAAALVRHLFEAAKSKVSEESAANAKSVTLEVLNSKPCRFEARHESDTYLPYLSGWEGFPSSAQNAGNTKPVASLEAGDGWSADLVLVIAPYFANESLLKGKVIKSSLDRLVPKENGTLVFQTGYNTTMHSSTAVHKEVWDHLRENVKSTASRVVFVSNGFSFAPGDKKPGHIDPTVTPFVEDLKKQNPDLWEHMFAAGICESLKFGADQMAKWLSFSRRLEIDFEESGLQKPIQDLRDRHALDGDAEQLSKQLQENFKSELAAGKRGKASPVRRLCEDLRALVAEKIDASTAEYLGRAVTVFDKFGSTLEVTDGEQILAVLQDHTAALYPADVIVMPVDNSPDAKGRMEVQPPVGSTKVDAATWPFWFARGLDAKMTTQWLNEAIANPEQARQLVPV